MARAFKERKPIDLCPEDVKQALAGSRAAFQRIVERIWGPVFVFVQQRVRDREQARDLTQETFLQAFDKRETVRKGESFVAWVFTIASRKVIDHYRRASVGSAVGFSAPSSLDARGMDEITQGAAGSAGSAGSAHGLRAGGSQITSQEVLEADEEAEQLRRAMEQLDDRYRAVLVLRYWSGLSPGQIARVLGEPEGTIRNRVFRAHQRLRAILESGAEGFRESRTPGSPVEVQASEEQGR